MTSPTSLSATFVEALTQRLDPHVPGARPDDPRPVHVLYGGAHLFSAASAVKLGGHARTAMMAWGADDAVFGRCVGVNDPAVAARVAARVRHKLEHRPVEAICIDFEDGYGPRTDVEEDAEAERTAADLASVPAGGPNIGIRIRALAAPTTRRALRTLDRFVTTLVRTRAGTSQGVPPGFTVTLPKVTTAEQPRALADALDHVEAALGLAPGTIPIELMIESPAALVDRESGAIAAPGLVRAARGRAVALDLGAYDLTAELGVTASDQRLDHPFCDLARMLLRLATTLPVADGATTLLPIPPKGAHDDGAAAVHRAWALHARNVTRAIEVGIWQGWDLHPAQLPARFGALFAHFIATKEAHARRLASFVERAMQASRVGQEFDDAATAQGLVSFFLRGLACGALDEEDLQATALDRAELETRSFAGIVAGRARASGAR